MTKWILLAAVLAGIGYIRFAPDDAARWHVSVDGRANSDGANWALRVTDGGAEALAQADAYMRALARTKVLAGSVAGGRITYVTRSKLMGFPDYITIELRDGQLRAFARARYGKSDLGVNASRLEGLLAALER